jgi:hypothetical protein
MTMMWTSTDRESLRDNKKKTFTHSLNNGLMNSAQNYSAKGSRLNCNGCKNQVKQMDII